MATMALAKIASISTPFKKSQLGISGKEGAKDVPSWSKGDIQFVGKGVNDFARRLLDEKYGPGNYGTSPSSEYNKIKKWAKEHLNNKIKGGKSYVFCIFITT